jgi:hypothetical protein
MIARWHRWRHGHAPAWREACDGDTCWWYCKRCDPALHLILRAIVRAELDR